MGVYTTIEGKQLVVGEVVSERVVGIASGYMHFIWHKEDPIITEPMTIERTYLQSDKVMAFSPDGKPLYDTFTRKHMISPWIYAGRCKAGQEINMDMRIAPYIYISSPYETDDDEDALFYSRLIMAACRECMKECGNVPVAPHMYFPMFLDNCLESEKKASLTVSKRLLEACSGIVAFVIDDYISDRMREELELAAALGMEPIIRKMTREEAVEFIDNNLR